jgi:hypothetical protein
MHWAQRMMDQRRAQGNAVARRCRRYVRQRTDEGETGAQAGPDPETLTEINGARREAAILHRSPKGSDHASRPDNTHPE